MAAAGYCTHCRRYMWLRPDGSCYAGHHRGLIVEPYEVDDVTPPTATALGFPPGQHRPTALIVTALLLALTFTCSAAVLLGASTGENGRALRKTIERMQSGKPVTRPSSDP